MAVLACGHDAPLGAHRLCRHLLAAKPGANIGGWARVLRGTGFKHDICCMECATRIKAGKTIELVDCLEYFDTSYGATEWIGEVIIEEAPVPLDATLRLQILPVELESAKALLPLTEGRLLLLVGQKLLLASEGKVVLLLRVPLREEKDNGWQRFYPFKTRLLISGDERFVAIVHDHGSRGVVVDLQAQKITMKLDRGDSRVEHTPFPVAFFHDGEKQLIVHDTAQKQLYMSDPQRGGQLPGRVGRTFEYYFHGSLLASPNGKWILDDGWIWGAAGVPTTLNLSKLADEPIGNWESTGKAANRKLCQRHYFWNTSMTWVGNIKVAIYGIGDDDESMLAGTLIFDAQTGEELNAFAGPSGPYFSDGTRLFSVEENGLHIWDVEAGTRIGQIPEFRPAFQVGEELIEINGRELRAWNYSKAFEAVH